MYLFLLGIGSNSWCALYMGRRTFRVSKGNFSGAYYNREITVSFCALVLELLTGRRCNCFVLYLGTLNSYSASYDNWCTGTLLNRVVTAQWEGMGDVGAARYEPALLPPSSTIRVLSYSNCQRSTHSSSRALQFKVNMFSTQKLYLKNSITFVLV